MTLNPTLGQVGERDVIEAIRHAAPSSLNGDDAAVLYAPTPNSRTVVSTDMLVESRHFRQDWSTPQEVGYKAITQNFADIEAMGARPIAALLAVAAPAQTPLSFIAGLAEGIGARCRDYTAELVGGDVTRADTVMITISAIGKLGGDRPALTLDGARVGQKIVAHGKLGHSAAGMALLERFGRQLPKGSEDLSALIDAHCAPTIDAGRGVIARATGATAMTDNSDGLIVDLGAIARASGVRMEIDSSAITADAPLIRAAELLHIDPMQWILTGGEDHTLLGTTHKECPSGFRVIGEVTRGVGVTVDGNPPAYGTGWESFA